MLTTMKAKWYQREMEKTLVRAISKAMADAEQRNIPANKLISKNHLTWAEAPFA
jgi:hypothetical protein